MRSNLLIVMATLGLLATPVLAADPIEGLARTCNNCHGINGVSAGPSMPSIGGQSEAYLKNVMMEWKRGERAAATMNRVVGGLSDDEIAALAKYYAAKPWVPVVQKASAVALKKGKEATEKCENCHGATGGEPDGADTPRLNGQWAKFLALELEKYRDEGFQMTHKKMIKTARKMEQGDVSAAAQFFGAQKK